MLTAPAKPSSKPSTRSASPIEKPKLNLLIAFPYCKKTTLDLFVDHQDMLRILIDSGAFTAWKTGGSIDLDDYCRFLETIPVKPWSYFMLDVIGDPVATWRNYETMLQRGFKPIPIFTRGEDPTLLDRYYERSDVVGVGGLVRTQRNRAFVNGIMNHIAGRKVHLLGFSDITFLKYYRPFSCDSSGWDQAPYGQLRVYMGSGQFAYLTEQQSRVGAPPSEIARRIEYYDVEPTALRKRSAWHGAQLERPSWLVCLRGMTQAAFDIETMLGTKYFFATTGRYNFAGLIRAWQWRMEKRR